MVQSAAVLAPSRVRRLRLDTAAVAPVIKPVSKVPPAMKDLALAFYVANREANATRAKADKERKALLKLMKDGDVESFDFGAMIDGDRVQLVATVATPDTPYIDVAELRKLLDDKTFMAVISATKTAVDQHCGTVVSSRVSKTRPGTENVSVSTAK